MKKSIRTAIIFGIMILMGLAYYFYISNKPSTIDSTQKAITDQELAALTATDIQANYPSSPREVLKLYSRISKAYYRKGTSEQDIEALGRQARLLFDDELKNKQSDSEFLKALKADVSNYNDLDRYISDYTVGSAADIEYKTIDNRQYAIGVVRYYIREGSKLSTVYYSYKLRQSNNGDWKILYWELVAPVTINEE